MYALKRFEIIVKETLYCRDISGDNCCVGDKGKADERMNTDIDVNDMLCRQR